MQDTVKQIEGAPAATTGEPFAIAASTSLQDVRLLVLKHGDGFGVFDSKGDVRRRAARRASIFATPAISPASRSRSSARRLCCSVRACATTTRR